MKVVRNSFLLLVIALVLTISSSAYAAEENTSNGDNKIYENVVDIETAKLVGERFLQESELADWD
ncbi:hypothetical protein KDC22_19895 [Paenibacillus tritici]|uniref:hypothetical protein n=1 Tax=Paenibacillus tritici TaxID=1873425 RepID=UPI001BADD9B3|nr:hypothetical protein [Paenibacillus tritici]QUL52696.1 hypothetical protein KDC22_19895 [Paenibacillus tritici]